MPMGKHFHLLSYLVMLSPIYSLYDGISSNVIELEAAGVGGPLVAKADRTDSSSAMSSPSLKSSAEQENLYGALTYGFHSFTDSPAMPLNVAVEACGYAPYGM
jgi:hypothetical protein